MNTTVKILSQKIVKQFYETTMISGKTYNVELSWRDDKLETIQLQNIHGNVITNITFEEWEAINKVMKFYMDSNDE